MLRWGGKRRSDKLRHGIKRKVNIFKESKAVCQLMIWMRCEWGTEWADGMPSAPSSKGWPKVKTDCDMFKASRKQSRPECLFTELQLNLREQSDQREWSNRARDKENRRAVQTPGFNTDFESSSNKNETPLESFAQGKSMIWYASRRITSCVCMHVCGVHVCTYCVYACMDVCVRVCECMSMSTCKHVCTCMCVLIWVCVCVYFCMER